LRIIKFLEDIGFEYLVILGGGFGLFAYILLRGMEMHPN